MDSQKFLQLIPKIFDFDNLESIEGKKTQIASILNKVDSTINPYVFLLLNTAISCLEENEIYCEILEKSSTTLIPILENNPQLMAYGIIDNETINIDNINHTLESSNYSDQVCIYEGDVTSFCEDLQSLNSEDKIGLFHLNGNRSYREILLALMNIRPLLAEEAFIIISQTENIATKNAISDFQNFNNSSNIHELLIINSDTKIYPLIKQELIILSWKDSDLINNINTEQNDNLVELQKLDLKIKYNYNNSFLRYKIINEIITLYKNALTDNNLSFLSNYYDRINFDLLKNIPCNISKIIEVGCGAGALGEIYKLINPDCEYIGIEIDKQAAKTAQNRLDKVIIDNIEQISHKIIGIEKGSIDCIIYGDVLEHLVNPWQVLQEHQSWLKNDGYIIACIPNLQHWSIFYRLINDNWQYEEEGLLDKTHLRFFTLSTIKEFFVKSGLNILKIEPRFISPISPTFFSGCLPLLYKLKIDISSFVEKSSSFQYVVIAQKLNQEVKKPVLIQSRISHTICRLIRVEYPHYFLQTNPNIYLKQEEKNDFQIINFEGDKIFIWQRPFLDYSIDLRVALEKQKQLINAGYLTIMELDDDPNAWLEDTRDKFYALAKNCHLIQTSTEKLADEMRKFHPQVVCFPNQLPYLFPYHKKFSEDKVTLLFAAQNRQSDWQVIINALNQIIHEYSDKLYIKVIYDRAFYEALKTDQKEFEDWCSYTDYQEILKSCDLHLIPLEDNQFNSMKSDLKFIESSAYGVVSLASPTVYKDQIIEGETGMIYHSVDEFKEMLILLITNKQLREKISFNAYNYVKQNRLLSQNYQTRLKIYQQMIIKINMLNYK